MLFPLALIASWFFGKEWLSLIISTKSISTLNIYYAFNSVIASSVCLLFHPSSSMIGSASTRDMLTEFWWAMLWLPPSPLLYVFSLLSFLS